MGWALWSHVTSAPFFPLILLCASSAGLGALLGWLVVTCCVREGC